GGGRSRDRRALRRPGVPGPRDLPRRAARAHARPAARLPRRLSHLVAHAARRHPEGPPRAQPEEVERRPCRLRRGGHAGRHPRLAPPRGRRSGDRRPGPDGARLLRRARPGRDGRPRAPGGDAVTGARTRALGAGVAGGLVAGAAVGAAEALAAWVHLHGPGELPALGWALVAYGAVGAVNGFFFGIIAAVLGTDGFALAFAAEGVWLAFFVARFRIIRDVFLEQVPHGPLALIVQAGALVAVGAIAFALLRALPGAGQPRAALTRPGIAAVVVALLAAAWAGGAQLKPPPTPAPLSPRGAAPAGAPNVVL